MVQIRELTYMHGDDATMRLAIADPPYPGMASRYAAEAKADGRTSREVNHALLIEWLDRDFDGWCLNTSSSALPFVLDEAGRAGVTGFRIGAWTKRFAFFKPGVMPSYCWEPVLFKPARRNKSHPRRSVVRDFVECHVVTRRSDGFFGAKPERVCWWMFDVLGADPSDDFADVFPGSGAVTRSWESWKRYEAGLFQHQA